MSFNHPVRPGNFFSSASFHGLRFFLPKNKEEETIYHTSVTGLRGFWRISWTRWSCRFCWLFAWKRNDRNLLSRKGYSQKNWRVCGPLPKALPYLWPKSAIFPTLFMPCLGRDQKFDTLFNLWPDTLLVTKMAKIDSLFMTKTAEKPYPWGRPYLYSPYKGVNPPPPGLLP